MQHIDPYSDDFFKKAAEDYPLKTDSGEWEDVAKKLTTVEQGNEINIERNYRNIQYRSVLVCALLLIPFAIAVTKYFHVGYKGVVRLETKKMNEKLSATNPITAPHAVNFNKGIKDEAQVSTIEKFVPGDNSGIVTVKKDFSSSLENEIGTVKSLNNSGIEKTIENSTINPSIAGDKKNLKEVAENASNHKNVDRKKC